MLQKFKLHKFIKRYLPIFLSFFVFFLNSTLFVNAANNLNFTCEFFEYVYDPSQPSFTSLVNSGDYILGTTVGSVDVSRNTTDIYINFDSHNEPGTFLIDYSYNIKDSVIAQKPIHFKVYDANDELKSDMLSTLADADGTFEFYYDGSYDLGKMLYRLGSGSATGHYTISLDKIDFIPDFNYVPGSPDVDLGDLPSVDYGTVDYFDGDLLIENRIIPVYMRGNVSLVDKEGDTLRTKVVYEGEASNYFYIDGITPGNTLNGYIEIWGEAESDLVSSTYARLGFPDISMYSFDLPDNISLVSYADHRSSDYVHFKTKIIFSDYYCTSDFVYIPYNVKLNHTINYIDHDSTLDIDESMDMNITFVGDWAGNIIEFSDIRDTELIDGQFSQIQNQQNDLINQQMQQQHQDSINQTNELTNGYDNSAGQESANKLEDITGNLNDAENSLFGNVSGVDEDYTDVTDFFTNAKILESFSFIKSIMESIYVAMGDFAMPITIAFLFIIVTRLIGYQAFASGGGE